MNYLLDTCALIWLGAGGGELSAEARKCITNAATLFYSPISAWEISRLQKEGKVVIPTTPEAFLADLVAQYDLTSIPPTDDVMFRTAALPEHHRDPADRMIIATALLNDLVIITGDRKFAQYGVRTIG